VRRQAAAGCVRRRGPPIPSVRVVFPARARTIVAHLRRAGAMCLVLAATARPAHAQIFSWVDANGSLVVSNVPAGTNLGIPSYEVPASDGIRSTRYVAPERSRSFDDLIDEHASRNGVRRDLVRAVIQVESAFNPRALSNKGAMGLMQLMPATARQFGVHNAFDPGENVRGGVAYLRQLLDRYDGDERLALAAYNAGPGAVDRHGHTVPPYRETRNYVSRVNGLAGARSRTRASSAGPAASEGAAPRVHIYRTVEWVDGREVVKYTDQKPADH
jgi:soluble lytic murein transglycosylase-like protein